MTRLYKHLKPHLSALLLGLLGITAALIATGYEVGSFTRMGPGFFPLVLGIILALLGGAIVASEPAENTAPDPIAWPTVRFEP